MARFRDIVEVRTRVRDPIQIGDRTITLQSKAVSVRWPGGGGVWNRPVAVLVERDGQVERIPIVDVTRVAILAMAGAVVLTWLLALGRSKGRREERKDDDGRTD
jgi:uncharacterized spore protein YtfJ